LSYAGYLADDYGALYALTNRRGDCTEYAYLATALARASSIPARMVGGYVTDRDITPRAGDYHNWAELYIDGSWRLLDAQKGNWLQPIDQYVAFRYHRVEMPNPLGTAHRFRIEGGLRGWM
jgi:transglutaminase-like putative cysteine protease